MIDMVKQMQNKFLEIQNKQMQELLKEETDNLAKEWPSIKPQICEELREILCNLHDQYTKCHNEKLQQEICYIQFSFLRTGIFDRTPCCRIDLYDKDWYASEEICYTNWSPNFISNRINKIWDSLLENFKKQTSAPEYFADDLIFIVIETFMEEFLTIIQEIVAFLFTDPIFQRKYKNNIKVYGGEFLDQCWLLLEGGNS